MGLNAYFAFTVVGGMGYSWQVALGCVFISGVLFFIISVLPIREWIVNAIPKSLKMAIAAGIGLFLALIALKNAGIVVGNQATLVTHGELTSFPVVMAALGFALIVALEYRRIMGGDHHRHPGGDGGGHRRRAAEVRGHLRRAALDRPGIPADGPRRRPPGRAGDRGVRLPVRRPVRQYRHADRARPSRRLHAAGRHRSPPEPRPDVGQRRRHDRRRRRHLDHDQLHRERGRHQRRRPHRPDRRRRRRCSSSWRCSSRPSPARSPPTRRRRRCSMSPA